jgi:hypothetical protein
MKKGTAYIFKLVNGDVVSGTYTDENHGFYSVSGAKDKGGESLGDLTLNSQFVLTVQPVPAPAVK